jgi:hypothetical protein
LVIHYSGLPLGLEYFANSGLVYGYVSYANIASNSHARSLEVTIFVNDGTGTESKTFQWQVEDTNRIPVLPDVSISEGDYINVKINAEDATGASLTYAADNLPRGLRIDSATGRITGTVSYRNVGPIEGVREFIINIRVTDGESEDMRTVTWTVQDKDWWSAPPNLTNLEGEDVCFELCAPSVSAGWDKTVRLCACKGGALFIVVLLLKDAADAVNRMRGRALSLVLLASPKIQIIRQDRHHARALGPAELGFGPRRRFTDVMCYHARALGPAELGFGPRRRFTDVMCYHVRALGPAELRFGPRRRFTDVMCYHVRALGPAELGFGRRRGFTDVMCYHARALGLAELPSKLVISQVGGPLPKLEEAQVANFVPITPTVSPAFSKT